MSLNFVTEYPHYTIVGAGEAGNLHSKVHKNKGFIEIDQQKINRLKEEKQTVYENYNEAANVTKIFDICVPTEEHLNVLIKIAKVNSAAKVILEKPVGAYEQLKEIRNLLIKFFNLKVCVQENYRESITTVKLANRAKHLFNKIDNIKVVSIKNRIPHFKSGRYVDPLGVWGYEGSHMITIFDKFCKIMGLSNAMNDLKATFTPLNLEGVDETKFKQGGSEVTFITDDKIPVIFHTCMTGKIKYAFPNLYPSDNTETFLDGKRKYRMFAVEGIDKQNKKATLVAFYDKVDDLPPLKSVIYHIDNEGKATIVEEPFVDDTLKANLEKCTEYLLDETGKIPNPSPVEEGIELVEKIMKFNLAEKS